MGFRRLVRSTLQRFGWDIVRYPLPSRPNSNTPAWQSVHRLDIRTVVDVGAFDGDTARLYHRAWPKAALHCFEPQKEQYAKLEEWAVQQHPPVHTYDFALGATPGTATMFSVEDRPQLTSMIRVFNESISTNDCKKEPMRIERMDDVLDAAALEQGIFLKIDVEGYEREVLHGAAKVLDRAAVCVIEVNAAFVNLGAADIEEIAGMLHGHGLSFVGMIGQHFNQNLLLYRGDAVFVNWSRSALRERVR